MGGSPSPIKSWTVPAGERAIRLATFVRRCLPHLSLREARRAIEADAFRVNDRVGRKDDWLCAGDLLTLRGFDYLLAQTPLPVGDLEVPILYEDEFILALDKPAGMPTHGFSGREKTSLANFVAAVRPSLCGVGRSRWEPGLVHRLDRDTSGVVLAAKEQGAYENLRTQFRRGLVKKKYWALVWGRTKKEGLVVYPLAHDPRDRRKMRVLAPAPKRTDQTKKWEALTRFRTVGQGRGFSLLEVEMATGVTHQIRVHLQAIGHPLVGDILYGSNQADPFRLGRHFLHAFYLKFCHPGGGRELLVRSPLPEELGRVLKRLGIRH